MQSYPDNHFSCIVTDSPYGIAFMGKEWDRGIPSIEYWHEMLRITKPGGHLIAAGLPRMMHRLISVIEDAGWEVRDLLMHIFGSGFPKSHNHFGIEGYGTALKPAWEGWSLCMKPCDGTFKQNAEKWGQAGINIDGCRIPSNEFVNHPELCTKQHEGWQRPWNNDPIARTAVNERKKEAADKCNLIGRWPANVIFDEAAAEMLDEQSGILNSKWGRKKDKDSGNSSIFGIGAVGNCNEFIGDSGGASRFFYCAKTSSKERNEGLNAFPNKETHRIGAGIGDGKNPKARAIDKNNHPTVKPLKLMEYLITLVMPPKDGILLDPFAGSGSTILAAHRLGVKAIGIEKNEEYANIARERLKNVSIPKVEKELDLFYG